MAKASARGMVGAFERGAFAEARVALDLSGESLHKRGYHDESVEAPLKENLAAAILIRAGWPAIASSCRAPA